jgi:hypothetical protein
VRPDRVGIDDADWNFKIALTSSTPMENKLDVTCGGYWNPLHRCAENPVESEFEFP